jgi:hypothetical protein
MMTGVDPWAFMQDLAGRLDGISHRGEIERALDDLEYLMEVLDPELQEPAYQLHERLRAKLEQASR